jgi:hypothetical protein
MQNVHKMSSREKNYGSYESSNNTNKEVASNAERKGNQPKLISYYPPPRQELRVDDRKDYLRHQPQPHIHPKKEEIRGIPNTVNPPTHLSNNLKKEDPKPIARMFNHPQPHSTPTNTHSGMANSNPDFNKKDIASRGAIQPVQNGRGKEQQPVTNKDIFPKSATNKALPLKDTKSIEKQYGRP